jgi:hypothetical protein
MVADSKVPKTFVKKVQATKRPAFAASASTSASKRAYALDGARSALWS